jgi:hypothetical protein
MTQTAWLHEIGCNYNSYRSFMRLKGAWNGTQNGVYWGAARFFSKRRRRLDREKKKRKAEADAVRAAKKRKAEADAVRRSEKQRGDDLLERLAAFQGYQSEGKGVFDLCEDVRRKCKAFLATGAMTKTAWLRHLGVYFSSYDSFMKAEPVPGESDAESCFWQQPGAGNSVYPKAYHFFEKMRLMEGKPKSAKRVANEAAIARMRHKFAGKLQHVLEGKKPSHGGFMLKHDNGKRWVFIPHGCY